jgi:hypothetical protein
MAPTSTVMPRMTGRFTGSSFCSARVGELCDIPGLRAGRIEGAVRMVLLRSGDHLDVVRLLAGAHDLDAAILDEFDAEQHHASSRVR